MSYNTTRPWPIQPSPFKKPGLFSRIIGGTGAAIKGTSSLAMNAVRNTYGPGGFGLIGSMRGARGLMARLAIPGLILGGLALSQSIGGLVKGGYSMHSPQAAWNNQESYDRAPMEFSAYRRSYTNMNANGNLAFALHNRRKA